MTLYTGRGTTGLNRSCRTMARLLTAAGHPMKKSTVQPILKDLRGRETLTLSAAMPAPTVDDSETIACGCLAVCDGSCLAVDQGPAVSSNHNKSNHNRSRPAKVSRSSKTKVRAKPAKTGRTKVGRKPKPARVTKAKVAVKPLRARIPRNCKTKCALKRRNRELAGESSSSESSSSSSGSDSSSSEYSGGSD